MKKFITTCFELVREANPGRQLGNVNRRLLKLDEEAGELSQAFLHVTSQTNAKKKSWYDVREECVDSIVPVIDIILTKHPLIDGKIDSKLDVEIILLVECFFLKKMPKGTLTETELLRILKARSNFSVFFSSSTQGFDDFTKRDWEDFKYRGIDLLRRQIAFATAEYPDQPETTREQRRELILNILKEKLEKWTKNRATGQQTTDDV
jgi:hypothetical protein